MILSRKYVSKWRTIIDRTRLQGDEGMPHHHGLFTAFDATTPEEYIQKEEQCKTAKDKIFNKIIKY